MQEIRDAQEAFKTWREVPAPKRGEVIRILGNKLREKKKDLAEIITSEVGKIYQESLGEVQEMIDICDFAVGLSRQLYGLTIASERPRHKMREQWHPLGPIGVITAFNFPGAVWAWNAAIAAVCGNTIVWKPSELAEGVADAVREICEEVMEETGYENIFNLAKGDKEIGQLLTEDKRIPLISFTGSCLAGRDVATTVADRFGKCILELGGNNAVIVAEDADLELATRAIVFGAVRTNGQRCTTTRRVMVHSKVAKELTKRLLKAYEQIVIDDPMYEEAMMGPLIDEQAVDNYLFALDMAIHQGGEILCGAEQKEKMNSIAM